MNGTSVKPHPNRTHRRLVAALKNSTPGLLICQRCKKRFVGVPLKDTCQCQRIKPKVRMS